MSSRGIDREGGREGGRVGVRKSGRDAVKWNK